MTVAERRVFPDLGQRILFGRNRFPCESGFFGFQPRAVEKPGVGGNEIPGFQTDDIAGDESGGVDHAFFPVADHAGMGRRQGFQRVQRFFGLALLIHPHDGVENHDQDDQRRFKQLAPILFRADDNEGDCRRSQQNEDHNVLKLIEEPLKRGFLFLFPEFVFSVGFGSPLNLGGGQTLLRIGVQLAEKVAYGLAVVRQRVFLHSFF